ncbi:pyrroline-5-carboxylate reductase [Clostridium butyricum]|uniref:Pyrroline-5-carboxylate reductase n=2 Tax=Clostridium butyricum TaxID=1492 RepID=C4IMT6_CLOBU|nr:pyrroline-5-carboxylate reductase [Clostridium butyricum]EDT76888.1 pyrroline-5-carboxylate reductase [Clostridium butyricum 5521]EEP52418.1 pyrroline-5-carboxylate reductase [Clostridium butyricum E4 str. BoNT E BL5262]NFL31701.1 pyrroline-5-carboxylate reductase [Clostridium butyricum]NFS19631.1 pyrroline-5-carboxylate reductase [Clostridium butyricum]
MIKKVGFIGCGNMGSSMVGGLIKSGFLKSEEIIVSTKTEASSKKLRDEFKVATTLDSKTVAKESETIILAVKPNMYKSVVEEIKSELTEDKLIITIAAGISIENMEEWLGDDLKIIRTMPNTPALVGQAMSAVCPNKNVSEEELKYCINIFESFGECEVLEEKYFDGFIAVAGSSPAYVFMFIEAMADGAVKLGIPRAKAYKMAAQSVLGSAKMVLETGKHPGELKDMVCSPAGTTIDAVVELEKLGFRNSVIQAMDKCAEKSKNMHK